MWRRFSHSRNRKGTQIIELGCVAIMLVIVTLLGTDVGIMVMGSSTNERACRDAARAAAQGNNYANALQLAQASLRQHRTDGYFLTNPQVDTTNFIYNDFAGNPPPNTSPFVSVTTFMDIRVPAPIMFAGATFNPGNGQMRFTKTYNFPIVKTTLYLN
jgi:Flp pilus assembly protein TadG